MNSSILESNILGRLELRLSPHVVLDMANGVRVAEKSFVHGAGKGVEQFLSYGMFTSAASHRRTYVYHSKSLLRRPAAQVMDGSAYY